MEGAGVIDEGEWHLEELRAELLELIRDGERDGIQADVLRAEIEARAEDAGDDSG